MNTIEYHLMIAHVSAPEDSTSMLIIKGTEAPHTSP